MKNEIRTAEEEIDLFLEMTLPKNAGAIQTREIRKAFIAGMHNFFSHVMSLNSRDGEFEDELKLYAEELTALSEKYLLKKNDGEEL